MAKKLTLDLKAVTSAKDKKAVIDLSGLTLAQAYSRVFPVLRARDLLNLEFQFMNLTQRVPAAGPAMLQRTSADQPAYIIVHFPPQSIAERAYSEGDKPERLVLPAAARLSGRSRLVFKVPDEVDTIPFDLETLLKCCARYRPHTTFDVPADGKADTSEEPHEPRPEHTAIEMPYRLILSPNSSKSRIWDHRSGEFAGGANQWTELWHTRLRGAPVSAYAVGEQERRLQVVWSPDYRPPSKSPQTGSGFRLPLTSDPFLTSLTRDERSDLVQFIQARNASDGEHNYLSSVHVNNLLLTSLGGWLDSDWHPVADAELGIAKSNWRHRATMGRDHYVRIVDEGYLCPFGHRAAYITITERKLEDPGLEQKMSVAALRQRCFVVVREPERCFDPRDHRQFPFRTVKITTRSTPLLDLASFKFSKVGGNEDGKSAFWPTVGGVPFQFHLLAEDSDGRWSEFQLPLAYVSKGCFDPKDSTKTADSAAKIIAGYHDSMGLNSTMFDGQDVAFCEASDKGENTTRLDTEWILFDTVASKLSPPFYPAVRQAKVRVPALQHLLGDDTPVSIAWNESYVETGWGPGEVFARIVGHKPKTNFGGSGGKSGGLVSPNFAISGLSRRTGLVGGPDLDSSPGSDADPLSSFDKGVFNPMSFFAGALEDATLFGEIPLGTILNADLAIDNAPVLTSKRVGNTVTTSLTWIASKAAFNDKAALKPLPGAKLELDTTTKRDLSGSGKTSTVTTATLRHFSLEISEVVSIQFNLFRYTNDNGSSDVDVDLGEIKFLGPLAFLSDLLTKIPAGLFGDGFSISASPSGVDAGFTIAIPPLALGAFNLTDVVFSTSLRIPFDGSPTTLRFAFCEKQRPFSLTVYGLGGGGFFGMSLDMGGVVSLEAALEFGAAVALDLGVASGLVEIKAGIYFQWQESGVTLAAYYRAYGCLDVLGLISISVEFYLELAYSCDNHKASLSGVARVTVEIDLTLFSETVEIEVRKSIGGGVDPTFKDGMVNEHNWLKYCNAFAA